MHFPKISIIIPVYNLEDKLGACLSSCVSQTYKDLEIVVVNDGSTDGSQDVIDSYLQTESIIVSIIKANEGVNLARMTGISHARGEYISFLDGDDVLPKNAIELMAEQAINEDVDIVVGNICLFSSRGSQKVKKYDCNEHTSGIEFLEYILKKKLHYLVGKLIRKTMFSFVKYVTGPEVVIGEDQILLCQVCLFARRVHVVHNVVYHYLLHDQSVTQRKTDSVVLAGRLEKLASSFADLQHIYNYNDLIRQQINYRIIESLHHALRGTGKFVGERRKMRAIYQKAIFEGLFGKKTLLASDTSMILRAIFSFVFPQVFSHSRKLFKIN